MEWDGETLMSVNDTVESVKALKRGPVYRTAKTDALNILTFWKIKIGIYETELTM